MKKIIVAVVVLLLALVVAPWGVGRVVEKRVDDGLDQLVKQAPYLTIVERKWTGGWFRSEQEVTFEVLGPWTRALNAKNILSEIQKAGASKPAPGSESVPAPEASSDAKAVTGPGSAAADAPPVADKADKPVIPPMKFTVRNEILHGPMLWPASLGFARINTRVDLSDDVRKTLIEVFGTDEPVHLSTRVHFFGGATTRLWGDGHTIKLGDKSTTIAYDDYKLDVGYSSHLDHFDMDGKWPKFVVNDGTKNESVEVKGVYLTGANDRIKDTDLYAGDAKFGIDEIHVVGADKAETTIEDVHYVVDTRSDGDFISMKAQLGSGKIRNKELAALKFDLNEVHYDFSFRRLHTETLQKMMVAMKKMYAEPVMDVAAMNAAMMQPFKQYAAELLKYDPEFVIDRVGIVTPEGEGVIKGVIKLKGVTPEDFASSQPAALLGKIDADLTIEVAQKLIEKIPNGNTGAGAAIDGGYAKRDGEKLVSHIEYKQGQLKINGKPQAIPGLGGPPPPPTQQE
jgi:uncharacterized protein YdgA (DUF945 family)